MPRSSTAIVIDLPTAEGSKLPFLYQAKPTAAGIAFTVKVVDKPGSSFVSGAALKVTTGVGFTVSSAACVVSNIIQGKALVTWQRYW